MKPLIQVLILGALAATGSADAAGMRGAGSTFAPPIMTRWAADYRTTSGRSLEPQAQSLDYGSLPSSRVQRIQDDGKAQLSGWKG